MVYSPNEHVVAHCYKVLSSGKYKRRKGSPTYALFGVEVQSHAFWGQAHVFLGWYENEEDVAKEVCEVKEAIKADASTYELKYSVKVNRQGLRMKIVEE